MKHDHNYSQLSARLAGCFSGRIMWALNNEGSRQINSEMSGWRLRKAEIRVGLL